MFNVVSTQIGAAQLAPTTVLRRYASTTPNAEDRGDHGRDAQRHQCTTNALHQWG
jgi:hypothetical protein